MKTYCTLVVYLLSFSWSAATTYYVSNDGSDAHSGQSPDQAWRSTRRVNALMNTFRPGDQILFRRGDRFSGGLTVTASGASGQPITFGAYGSGNQPIIDGLRLLRQWKDVGKGIWRMAYDAPLDQVSNLVINGRSQTVGRYPNLDDANGGYLTIRLSNGRNWFVSNDLRRGPWAGGEVVIRSKRWILDRVPISRHEGNTLWVTGQTSYHVSQGYGCFIVNHRGTLDQDGEWMYDPQEKALFLRLSRNPNTIWVMVNHVPELFSLRGVEHVVIEHLKLFGSAQAGVRIRNSKHITVQQCLITTSGTNGIKVEYSDRIALLRNQIEDTNNNGISVQGGAYTEVADNTILRTGMLAGMGGSGNGSYRAVQGITDHFNVHRNVIDQVGYSGIAATGDHLNIQYNQITNFCQVKDDGGGIYLWERTQYPHQSVQIKNNVVGKGGTTTTNYGTPYTDYVHASGIYLDNYANGAVIERNTVYSCGNYGVYIHNAYRSTIRGNMLYDNRRALGLVEDDRVPDGFVRDLIVERNVLFARQPDQRLLYLRSIHDQQFSFGTIDQNYYHAPLNKERTFRLADRNYKSNAFNLAQWQQASPFDQASRMGNERWPEHEVARYLSDNLLTNPSFSGDVQGWRAWSSGANGTLRHTTDQLDGGNLMMHFPERVGTSRLVVSPADGMGPVREGERYLLRYDLASSGSSRTLDTRLQARHGGYKVLSNVHYASPTPQRQTVETFLTIIESDSDGLLKFGTSEHDQQFYIDNVELRRVQTQPVDYNDYVQFVVNTKPQEAKFSLPPGEWQSPQGSTYRGSVTLPRAQSIVLLRSHSTASRTATARSDQKEVAELTEATETPSLLRVYPNPLQDGDLTVVLDSSDEQSEISVYNASGRLLRRVSSVGKPGVRFSKAQLGKGIRLIKIVSDGRIRTEKVVVE